MAPDEFARLRQLIDGMDAICKEAEHIRAELEKTTHGQPAPPASEGVVSHLFDSIPHAAGLDPDDDDSDDPGRDVTKGSV